MSKKKIILNLILFIESFLLIGIGDRLFYLSTSLSALFNFLLIPVIGFLFPAAMFQGLHYEIYGRPKSLGDSFLILGTTLLNSIWLFIIQKYLLKKFRLLGKSKSDSI